MESAPSETSTPVRCSFCGLRDDQTHQCRSEAFDILNRLAQGTSENPFSQVENLVFQGGGVKGIAYVGVLKKLFDEYKVHEQVKRVAGSSAGSIAALYICLGLSTETIEKYMNDDMLEKLETEPSITVGGQSYPIRDVFDKVLDFSGSYTKDDLTSLFKDVVSNLLKESLSWLQGILASKFASGSIANALASFLAPGDDDQSKKTIRQRLNDLEDEIKKEEEKYNPQPPQDQIKEQLLKAALPQALPDRTAFHKALSELIYQTFLAPEPLFPEGWFPGEKIKEDLIKKPIEEAYRLKGLEVPDVDKLTFEEFAKARVGDKPAFKKLYVTAFNTVNQRTEVFSVDHTPNVIVIDAVRASMSIPAFFTTVPIREKNVQTNAYPVRRMYLSENKWGVTRYMDGGILDNYPIWIFDDLQYCLGDNANMSQNWKPKQRIEMRNPFTLGIKLIDCPQRQQFLNPYFDTERLHPKALHLPTKVSVASLLGTYFTASSEDNQHIQRGDTSRTIYVDNLGVTAISFKLSGPEKLDLQKAGELAVRQYVNYAQWDRLSEIGQNYYPIQRSAKSSE